MLAIGAPGDPYALEPEASTDEQGRFRFSNLPEGEWELNDRSGLIWEKSEESRVFETDRSQPIELKATLTGREQAQSGRTQGMITRTLSWRFS